MSAGRRALWAGGFALALFGAFPHPVGEAVVDLGLVLGWLPPALLLLCVRGLSPRRAAAWGLAAGVAGNAAVLHWFYVVTVRYGGAPPAVGVLAPVLAAFYGGAFSAAFAAYARGLAGAGRATPWALAAGWAALDHGRSFLLSGFPWATLGYSQHLNPALTGLAAWTGVYGLSFAAALGGAALLAALSPAPAEGAPRRAGLAGAVAVLGLHAVGLLAVPAPPGPDAPRVAVAVLQGNIDQGVKWSPDWAERTLVIYEELTRRAAAEGARIVVWPETAVPGSPDGDPGVAARLAALAKATDTLLVVGAVGLEWVGPAQGRDYRVFDSAFVFADGGRVGRRYDKTHLVPFGEYLPLRGLLGGFIQAIARGSAGQDVTPGPAPRALSLPGPPGEGVSVGVPICYELIFPDLVRRFVGDGAQLLLAITNDAWYGRTGAPFQFLAMTALRSAETGTWTARAANTGVSAFVDARGRVRERTRIFERGFLVAELPLRPAGAPPTPYVRFGDVFAWVCWGVAGTLGIAVRLRSRDRAGEER